MSKAGVKLCITRMYSYDDNDPYQPYSICFENNESKIIEYLPTAMVYFLDNKYDDLHIIPTGFIDPLYYESHPLTVQHLYEDSPLTFDQAMYILECFNGIDADVLYTGDICHFPEEILGLLDDIIVL